MPRSYPYGTVPAAVATIVSERGESPMVCCGYCSAHMAARQVDGSISDRMTNEAHNIRREGGRPHNKGSNATELRNGTKAAVGVTLVGIDKGAIMGRLRAGFAVVASVDYGPLPAYLKVQGGAFGHSVMLLGRRFDKSTELIGYFDPLYEQGSKGTWTKWSDIDQAIWDGGHNTTVAQPASGGTDVAIQAASGLKTNYTCKLSEGRDFYADAALTQRKGELSKGATAVYVGIPKGVPSGTSRAVLLNTGTMYEDKQPRPTVMYVTYDACVGGPQAVPPTEPPPPGPGVDEDAIKAARDEEWREWLLAGSPGDQP